MSKTPSRELIVREKRSRATKKLDITASIPTGAPGLHLPVGREEPGRRCGRYSCLGDDVLRVASAERWLTGNGLAVFAESVYQSINNLKVAYLDSELFWYIRRSLEAQESGDITKAAARKAIVLSRAAAITRLPEVSRWLITVHIEQPLHWTLVQIHWIEHTVSFFDSFAASDRYAAEVKRLSSVLVAWLLGDAAALCANPEWRWISEQRDNRQSNSYDCGEFIAADIMALMYGEKPSVLTQEDMPAWRARMARRLRTLPAL